MNITQLLYISSVVIASIDALEYIIRFETKKARCLNPPRTARKVESVIGECQDEVRNKLVNEAYEILKEQVSQNQPPPIDPNDDSIDFIWPSNGAAIELDHPPSGPLNLSNYEYIIYDEPHPQRHMARLMRNIRRLDVASSGIYHPTLVPLEDKRIAGCLLHCVYARNNAIDHKGWPTLDGLVQFYSEGVHEHGFFMATLRAVNICLRTMTARYGVDRKELPQRGESCDLAFDVFDCISDQITGYCLDQYSRY
ncbi:Odorant-binding protein 73a [Drosophila ananassae]|uniref:Odorant-binding protein 73a n=1 Tax=Drosophila ananassae TaxID=7217 RepID=B3M446_DROAN|nr:general odorant-binding protein 70 [Drosophila ananassae]EDV40408.1 Odorant-binding protein 73a [Drosophila ananassae]